MNYDKFTSASEGGTSCGDMAPIVTLFFDFYALCYLSKGHGFLPDSVATSIQTEYEACVDTLYNTVRNALQNSVNLECKYLYNGTGGTRVDRKEVMNEIKEMLRRHHLGSMPKDVPPEIAVAMFDLRVNGTKVWSKGWGGGAWGRGADKLCENPRTSEQKAIWIDNVFDLQHNNGFILNKTGFRVLLDNKKFSTKTANPLDFRKELTEMKDMLPYVSSTVAKRLRYVENRSPDLKNAAAAKGMLDDILGCLPPEIRAQFED